MKDLLYDRQDSERGCSASGQELGAHLTSEGTCFRVWAPQAKRVEIVIFGMAGTALRRLLLRSYGEGWFQGMDLEGKAGDRYKIRLDEGPEVPDPASRWQPEGPHGPSMVVDASAFAWSDSGWARASVDELVIYELHIGTFTPAGTFTAAASKLPHVKDLGATAIEIMPSVEFAGTRNWGYDGVSPFAPAHVYGTPDDLRQLVDEAHRLGLTVILDVVYNHFGPDGNYLALYAGEYLDEKAKTPWGGAIRYGDPGFEPLRQMLVSNVRYWMRDFHIDGFRLDATHAIQDASPVHILREVTDAIHAAGGIAIAEDNRNDARLCLPSTCGGLGFDAVWADDFHHVLRVGQTGESAGYFADYQGKVTELFEVLRSGWLYQGQTRKSTGQASGTSSEALGPACFVICISNHDQVGNRAFGERLHSSISPAAYRALSALLCLSPYTPLLFMGQEWAASTPFLYFTDHGPELGPLVTAGRREEFAGFPGFESGEAVQNIPDPQDPKVFEQSKLRWDELSLPPHAQVAELYRECLKLRKSMPLLVRERCRGWQLETLAGDVIALHYGEAAEAHSVFIHLHKQPVRIDLMRSSKKARILFSSNEARFGGTRESLPDAGTQILLEEPEVLLVSWQDGLTA